MTDTPRCNSHLTGVARCAAPWRRSPGSGSPPDSARLPPRRVGRITTAGVRCRRNDQPPALDGPRRAQRLARLRRDAGAPGPHRLPRVELALGYFGRTAQELRRFLDGIGIKASSSHDGIAADAAALEEKIANARTLGQRFMVVPYLNSDREDDWKRWAEQMNVEAAAARRAGLRYGYHNHAHEFTIDFRNGRRPWDVLTEELDPRLVHLEIDIYWAVTGGITSGEGVDDPEGFTLDVIRSAPQRVLQYHVKDRDPATGDMADLGTGMIDFARIFRGHQVMDTSWRTTPLM
ncbi:sugar phosphate isomerase/epimerase [Micromonospora sp. BRA006-A]|nr:sugar phosphate isomerase/epimerase [Micromonospora sp. BRA006-A]